MLTEMYKHRFVVGRPAKSFIRLSGAGAVKTRAVQNPKHFTAFSCEINVIKTLKTIRARVF